MSMMIYANKGPFQILALYLYWHQNQEKKAIGQETQSRFYDELQRLVLELMEQ